MFGFLKDKSLISFHLLEFWVLTSKKVHFFVEKNLLESIYDLKNENVMTEV